MASFTPHPATNASNAALSGGIRFESVKPGDKITPDIPGDTHKHKQASEIRYDRARQEMESMLHSMSVALDRLKNALSRTHGSSPRVAKLRRQQTALEHFMGEIESCLSMHADHCHDYLPLRSLDRLMFELLAQEHNDHPHGDCPHRSFADLVHPHHINPAVWKEVHETVSRGLEIEDEIASVKNGMDDIGFAILLAELLQDPEHPPTMAGRTLDAQSIEAAFYEHVEQEMFAGQETPDAAGAPSSKAHAEKKKAHRQAVNLQFQQRWHQVHDMAAHLQAHHGDVHGLFCATIAPRLAHAEEHLAEFMAQHPQVGANADLAALVHEIKAIDHIVAQTEHCLAGNHDLGAALHTLHEESAKMEEHCNCCEAEISQSLFHYARHRFHDWVHANREISQPGGDALPHRHKP